MCFLDLTTGRLLASELYLSAQAVQGFPGFSLKARFAPHWTLPLWKFQACPIGKRLQGEPRTRGILDPLWLEHIEVPQKELESVVSSTQLRTSGRRLIGVCVRVYRLLLVLLSVPGVFFGSVTSTYRCGRVTAAFWGVSVVLLSIRLCSMVEKTNPFSSFLTIITD